MTEAQQQLAEVRAAIKAILEKGQRVRKGDREVQRAELASLRVLADQLEKTVAAEQARRVGRNRINYVSI